MRIWLLLLCSALIIQSICAHPISHKGIKKSDDVLYAPPRFYGSQNRDLALCARGLACGLESGISSARLIDRSLVLSSLQALKMSAVQGASTQAGFFSKISIPSSTILESQTENKKLATAIPSILEESRVQKLDSKPTYYKPDSPNTYLNTTIGLLGGGIIVSIIGLYIMPESVTNWDRSRFGFKAWLQDVKIGPVIDVDNFWLNGVAHPYFGAVYYMQPRVAGYSWAESTLFSFITSSIFWEYGIEAFVEIPSWQDLIYTPAMGSIFGEIFYQSTKYIQSNDNRLFGSRILGLIVVGLMDPIGVIMRDFGLAKSMGAHDVRQITSYAMPMRVGFAMRF